ncbi:protein kinase domain-containing protein [Streptomyces fuscichromogenes]|uniref:Protein kinase n=1 Tax=Streptomyces fuscichromogenes TaxID=1324013 RepID=A0A918CUR1_9ACTN|nr:protein kinase [Streptomyces fuscichromogenes]GGN28725.1 protein kinase [Streptomyces fuscichromogenes]
MAALEPGDPRSVGEYQLLRRLGAGGMGRVYLGRSPGGRAVAVKVVHAELVAGHPEFRSRFRREVAAARKVSGAFTAPVVDADPDAPLPWLVTSYIAGPSLQEAVAERGPLPAADVLALAAGLAEALTSVHAAGLVHRDLKPSNVLLAEDGPRVIDFGIARSVESVTITRAGLMVGSPGFMSPEQVAGGEVTGASDVFALGAVLMFAATGGNPFGAGPTPALLYRVVHDEPDLSAVTDPALAGLIADCLAKDPDHRPTPREILTRIAPAADTTALLARPAADPRTGLAEPRTGLANHAPAPVPAPAATRPVTRLDHPAPAPEKAPPEGVRRRTLLVSGGVLAVAALGAVPVAHLLGRAGNKNAVRRTTGAVSVPSPLAAWPLEETSGTVAADDTGRYDAVATAVGWGRGKDGSALFDGVSSQVVTRGQVLRTGRGRSFTVSAWVCLNGRPASFATAVAQDAGDASGFYLQYSPAENRWAFARPGLRALSYSVPEPGAWTHLVGVYEGPRNQLLLYVGGTQEAGINDTGPVAADGPLTIGRATGPAGPTDWFPGSIKQAQVFQRALTATQVKALF